VLEKVSSGLSLCLGFYLENSQKSASSTIIEKIETMRKSGLASVAMFYCDFREDQKKEFRGLLSSVLVQLCRQSDSYCDLVSKLYSDHEDGSEEPRDVVLVSCLKRLLQVPRQAPIFLIVDALDECPDTPPLPSSRQKVLKFLNDLIGLKPPNLRICVTSRPEADIKAILEHLTFCSISLHDESGQKEDIRNYIKWFVDNNIKMKTWSPEFKQLVKDVLTKRSDGM
jgi:hypothetical protein